MDNTNEMLDALKKGIDNNSTEAPALSIDPDTQKVAVVGDPNKVAETKGNYSITFVYPADQISEEDKLHMKKNEDGEYEAVVNYEGKRVKPLHRTTVAIDVAKILNPMGVILLDGSYTTDEMNMKSITVFLENVDVVADMARIVLDIPEEQLGYIAPTSLVEFFTQFLANEPNVVKEAGNFLEQSLVEKMVKTRGKNPQPNTRRS